MPSPNLQILSSKQLNHSIYTKLCGNMSENFVKILGSRNIVEINIKTCSFSSSNTHPSPCSHEGERERERADS